MAPRYSIGIDLGTTNSALSFIDTASGGAGIESFSIPQLVAEGVVQGRPVLPSFLYLPGDYELPRESIALPWDQDAAHLVGEFARLQGARVPSNLVSSAKSWLSHSRVDRKGPILPWGRETAARRVSPVEASSLYLKHLKDAWNYVVARGDEARLLERQRLAVTIPASFDEAARELTAEAARRAGLPHFTMLEEPQAAFYAWLAGHDADWRDFVQPGALVLVFDVGGGTTDFTLIAVHEENGAPLFRRVAVGDHILLGGDNMDLALARQVEKKLLAEGGKFDYLQWLSAVQQCRAAKEELLGESERQSVPVTILGRGRRVVGDLLRTELTADEVRETVVNGFFGQVALDEPVQRGRSAGLQELGLPFAADTAVLRHLASFLKRHAGNKELPRVVEPESGAAVVRPDMLLFNGGVFKAAVIREHAAAVVKGWFNDGSWTLRLLENENLDQAVAIGAAYYGAVREGRGRRIAAGTARAYYIGVERPGEPLRDEGENLVTVVCVLPRGFEEGQELHLAAPEFRVLANSPVSFTLYSSSFRVGDEPGQVITTVKEEFVELPPIKTVLHFGKSAGRVKLPVSLGIRLNEFGTLDIWCESKKTPHRWKLAFQLRDADELQTTAAPQQQGEGHTLTEAAVDTAAALMESAFPSASPEGTPETTPENVVKKMEASLELERTEWPLSAIRKLWDRLIPLKERRRTTPRREARWLSLSGFLLRPGFGYELDDWRVGELWKLISEGVTFSNDVQCAAEWWIMWRRVAGGLTDAQQDVLFKRIAPWLLPSRKKAGLSKQPEAVVVEMWMLAASLERLPVESKSELGDELLAASKRWRGRAAGHFFWILSRLGARAPFHGPIEKVVPKETAERWITALLGEEWPKPGDAVFALTQMGRMTGDRSRDIGETLRLRLIERLAAFPRAEHSLAQLRAVVALGWEDEKSIFGESLPAGLYIADESCRTMQ